MTAANAAQAQAGSGTATTDNAQQADGQGAEQNYTPPATQADLDRIVSERLARQKAQFKDYDQFKAAADELATIKAANQTAEQRQAEELAKWQSEAETWRKTAVGSRIEAIAASSFADPSDAVGSLDPAAYLDAGGQINDKQIQSDLAALLERKPHWRKPDGTPAGPRVPAPNSAQGSGGGAAAGNPAQEFAALLQGQLRS